MEQEHRMKLKCQHCAYLNPDGSLYCQKCGTPLKSQFTILPRRNENTVYVAGAGARGVSIAPLLGREVQRQAAELVPDKAAGHPYIRIEADADGSWYCPLCGDHNRANICKGCGFEKIN